MSGERQDQGDPLRVAGTVILSRDGVPVSPIAELRAVVIRWLGELAEVYPSSLVKRAISEARRYGLEDAREIALAVLDSLLRYEAGEARKLGKRRTAIRRAKRALRTSMAAAAQGGGS